ncbi:MAG: S8 family serine peptidase, partial [Candidatus Saliniplasma sp.]
MKTQKIMRMFSIVVALLMVISAITVASTVLAEEQEETMENNEEISETDGKPELDIQKILENRKIDAEDFPIDRIDALDPEMTEILSGSDVSSESLSSSNKLMTDQHTYDQHSVDPVHDMGITGENVTVSLMDTGFDMAHPDLIGTQAVFEYDDTVMEPEMEMYDGYPIAFDPVSMADYVYDGEISQDYSTGFEQDNSWYVNTSYEATAFDEDGTIYADFTLKEDNITYEMPDTVVDGDQVRFGLHPDEKLKEYYGERPAVLLTTDGDGDWGEVYTDLNNDRNFSDENSAYIDGTDPESEVMTKDIDGDGIADISGGMVYFVAKEHDGAPMPIPYAQQYRETLNQIINLYLGYPPGTIENVYGVDAWELITGQSEFYDTPEPGDMVALMGDFNSYGSNGAHGTWTASAVAGQAVTGVPDEDMLTGEPSPYPPTPEGGDGLPRGISPNAKIIPMGRFFDGLPEDHPMSYVSPTYMPVTYSSAFFTTEGYTGNVSITSDSADIASSSFGRTVDENHGGFNFYERLFDYLGTQYTQNTLFINSQGNEGSGFGTVSAPSGAQGVLSVGATGNQLYRVDGWNMYDGGPNPWYGEVTGMTSTGPHAKGSHGPDIMTNGQFGYSADPVNQKAQDGYFQGNNSWTLWSGTSLSAPNAAGIAALVFEAYVDAHGEAPDSATLKNLIMQGATDINNTPNLQGPGDANAYNSVLLAQAEGLYSEEFQWRPGTNPEMGQHVEHHVNMMEPGESQTDTLTLDNWNDTDPIEYDMNAYREEQVGSTQIELESGPSGRVPLLVINETGVYELIYNETNDNWDLSEDPIAVLDDPDADIFRFGTHTPYENQETYDYSLAEFYHWTDDDDNGSFDGFDERNRIGSTTANGKILEQFGDEVHTSDYFTIHDALER